MPKSEYVPMIHLYLDDSAESDTASKLVQKISEEHGVPIVFIRIAPGYGERHPLAIYRGWRYEGIEKVILLQEQIAWARKQQEQKFVKHSAALRGLSTKNP